MNAKMFPVFNVKSSSIYTFDHLFLQLNEKYPWIKDYGYIKLYVTDREIDNVTDIQKLKKFRLQCHVDVVSEVSCNSKPGEVETLSGIFTFTRKNAELKPNQTFFSYQKSIQNDPEPSQSFSHVANPREFIEEYWKMHKTSDSIKHIERYAYAWNGSIFDDRIMKMNLSKLNNALEFVNGNCKGISQSMLLIAGKITSFEWHKKDHDMASILYHHFGGDKCWIIIHPKSRSVFETEFKKAFALFGKKNCANPLQHKVYLTDLKWLDDNNIEYSIVRQEAGSYMIILPAVYHSGYNIDTNVTEGRNFICPLWAEQYKDHVPCDCGNQKLVEIDLKPFVHTGILDLTINTANLSAKVFNNHSGPAENENENKSNENVISDAIIAYENIEYIEFENIDASATTELSQINVENMQSVNDEEIFDPNETSEIGAATELSQIYVENIQSANDEEIFEPQQKKKVGRKKQTSQQCSECGKVLSTKYLLEQHVQRHHNSPTLSCPVGGCSGLFHLRKHVIQHLRKKHKMDLQAANIMERGLSK